MICHVYKRGRFWWGKVKLDTDTELARFSLGTTDKRVAQAKLADKAKEREKEAAGLLAPRSVREAAGMTLTALLSLYLEDVKANRAHMTAVKYENSLTKLFVRCHWRLQADITVNSFTVWWNRSPLSRKTLNDLLGAFNAFFGWLVSQRLASENPLKHLRRKDTRATHKQYRRSFTKEEMHSLLSVAPVNRRMVYQVAVYTGLRRMEMKGLRWADFMLEGEQPYIHVRAGLSGNKSRKDVKIPIVPVLLVALRAFKSPDAAPFSLVLAGLVPKIPRFKKDLVAAGVRFVDEHGRRADLHALRDTFITDLVLSGMTPYEVMTLARHSSLSTTMKYYVDVSRLPLAASMAKMTSYGSFGVCPETCPKTCPNVGLSQLQGVAS